MRAGAEAVARFVDALAFNWIIAGTDAHAKNYSILLSGAQVGLAPIYDVASALPYDFHVPKLKMAMRIGGEYALTKVEQRHWHRLAGAAGLDPDGVIEQIGVMAEAVPDAFADVVKSDPVTALDSQLPAQLLDRVATRARSCQHTINGQGSWGES